MQAPATDAVKLAEERLRVATHNNSSANCRIGENLLESPDTPLEGLDNLNALRAEASEKRPEVKALEEMRLSIQKQREIVRAGIPPRLDTAANGIIAYPNVRVMQQQDECRGSRDVSRVVAWNPLDIPSITSRMSEIAVQ
ncbi:hypothetical protein [Pajaroellobacter abortibovis]|uniref:Uncharacterized protein n=1 Tax=Pajaroellobacter abortibovis TaxID=1882918 RepID=A0A1L6MUZ4_9BACT|nr:hypothetical protein [Pajaroellobacter abortibovis]APR99339.1 hypothetical protein BCY86_00590 [Pajaroellobacter abortibovis]